MTKERTPVRILLALLAGTPVAAGATVIVSPGQSIQTAINGAVDGDEIHPQPGIYNEAIDFVVKSIHVLGVGGPDVTTISGAGTGTSNVSFVSGEPPASILEGVTVTGGEWIPDPIWGMASGGGIYCDGGSQPTIRRCRVEHNQLLSGTTPTGFGGGLYVREKRRLYLCGADEAGVRDRRA